MNRPRPTFFNLPSDKQERITEAAIEEFAEKGFHGASINEIVKHLKIAKGSIFQYFGDKKGLFYFVFDRCMDQVRQYLKQVRDATKGEPLSKRLTGVLLAGVDFVRTHPLLYRLYVRELSYGKTRFSGDLSTLIRRHSQEFLVSLVDEARKNGELPAKTDMDTAG
ncbi:MAG: TetR/AcrR family transcriptional regulator, partial [Deltaproteobacteria bacterium]|nr:TetR/AcrR family transcriptional regulator [Deltaproteobacteria bacterium]